MGSITFSRQNTFHFPMQLPYLLVVEGRLLSWMILKLSAERLVALGFCLISCKLVDSACWLEGVVCSLQDVKGGFCQNSKTGISVSNFIRGLYHDCVGQLGTTMISMATSKTILCNTFPVTARWGGMHRRAYPAMILKKH